MFSGAETFASSKQKENWTMETPLQDYELRKEMKTAIYQKRSLMWKKQKVTLTNLQL
jgi:hypothetical protein